MLLDNQSLSYRHPSPKVSLGHRQGQTAQPHFSAEGAIFPQFFEGGGLSIENSLVFALPYPTNQAMIPQQRSPYLSQSSPIPQQAGRQAGRAGRRLQDLPTFTPWQPQRYLLTITTTMMAQMAPSMIII